MVDFRFEWGRCYLWSPLEAHSLNNQIASVISLSSLPLLLLFFCLIFFKFFGFLNRDNRCSLNILCRLLSIASICHVLNSFCLFSPYRTQRVHCSLLRSAELEGKWNLMTQYMRAVSLIIFFYLSFWWICSNLCRPYLRGSTEIGAGRLTWMS